MHQISYFLNFDSSMMITFNYMQVTSSQVFCGRSIQRMNYKRTSGDSIAVYSRISVEIASLLFIAIQYLFNYVGIQRSCKLSDLFVDGLDERVVDTVTVPDQSLAFLDQPFPVIACILLDVFVLLAIGRSSLELLLVQLTFVGQLLLQQRVVVLQHLLVPQQFVTGLLKTSQFFPERDDFLLHLAVVYLILLLYLVGLLEFPRQLLDLQVPRVHLCLEDVELRLLVLLLQHFRLCSQFRVLSPGLVELTLHLPFLLNENRLVLLVPALDDFYLLVLRKAFSRYLHDLRLQLLLKGQQLLLAFGQLCQFASQFPLQQREIGLDLFELFFLLKIAFPLLLADIRPKLYLLLLEGQPRLCLFRLLPGLQLPYYFPLQLVQASILRQRSSICSFLDLLILLRLLQEFLDIEPFLLQLLDRPEVLQISDDPQASDRLNGPSLLVDLINWQKRIQHSRITLRGGSQRLVQQFCQIKGDSTQQNVTLQSIGMPQLQLHTLSQPACHFRGRGLEVAALEAILQMNLCSRVGDCG